jgi:hypothetical protein
VGAVAADNIADVREGPTLLNRTASESSLGPRPAPVQSASNGPPGVAMTLLPTG